MERWTKRDGWGDAYIDTLAKNLEFMIEKLAYYEDLEEQGLIKILPCKEGDIVYKQIIQHDSYDDSEYKIISAVCFRLDMLDKIGKSVFLTREEAELKLMKRENE